MTGKKSVGIGGYIWKQMTRKKLLSLILIILPLVSIAAVTQLTETIQKNQCAIQEMYASMDIRCTLMPQEWSAAGVSYQDLINTVVDELQTDERITDLSAEAAARCNVTCGEHEWKNNWLGGVMNVSGFQKTHQFEGFSVEWMEGMSDTFFETTYTSNEEYAEHPQIVVSQMFAGMEGLSVGDLIDKLEISDGFSYENVEVVGICNDLYGGEIGFIPVDVFRKQKESGTMDVFFYKDISFSIAQDYKVNYEEVAEQIGERLSKKDAAMVKPLQVIVKDDTLKVTVKPLMQTVRILEKLRPILIVIFYVCEAGILFLMLELRKNEVQIMKMLGTSRKRIWSCFVGEYVLDSLIGSEIGVLLAGFVMSESGAPAWYQVQTGVLFCLIAAVMPMIRTSHYYRRREVD